MPEVVNMKATGAVEIITLTGECVVYSGDPSISTSLQTLISSLSDYLEYEGASEIHMEKDTFRVFTHIVKGGVVEYHQGIARPEFEQIIAEVTANPPWLAPQIPPEPEPPAP